MDNNIKQEFDNKIKRLTKSKTYLDYCEEVYGYRMYLFNMMDEEQLDFVFDSIPLSADDTVLDLGCGTGSILNALVKKNAVLALVLISWTAKSSKLKMKTRNIYKVILMTSLISNYNRPLPCPLTAFISAVTRRH